MKITPDSGSVLEDWRQPAVIEFDEVIDERSGGGLERLIALAPLPEALEIDWRRNSVAVKPKGGWRKGTIYQLHILPGIADLRSNRTTEGRTVIFSTGAPIPPTRIEGIVLDWEAGRPAPRALVEAILLPDSLVYPASADSAGEFRIVSVPQGRYRLTATVDANNNRRRDYGEPFDSVTVTLDSAVNQVLWTLRRDTLGPRIARAAAADSVTLRVELDQALLPQQLHQARVEVMTLPDSVAFPIAAVWSQSQYDSVRAAEGPAPAPTGGPDTLAFRLPGRPDTTARAAPKTPARAAPDTSRAATLLASRPKPSRILIVRLANRLQPGGRYLVRVDAVNVLGSRGQSRFVVVLPSTGGRR